MIPQVEDIEGKRKVFCGLRVRMVQRSLSAHFSKKTFNLRTFDLVLREFMVDFLCAGRILFMAEWSLIDLNCDNVILSAAGVERLYIIRTTSDQ